jgi:hypothetical protein
MGTTTRPPRAAPGFPRPRSGVRNGPHRASRGPFPTARGERFENSPGPAASASKIYRRLRRAHRKSPTTRPGRVGICRRLHGTLRKSTGACAGLSIRSETRIPAPTRRNLQRDANGRHETPEPAGETPRAPNPFPERSADGRLRTVPTSAPATPHRGSRRTPDMPGGRAPRPRPPGSAARRRKPQRDAKIRSQTRTPATRRKWPQPDAVHRGAHGTGRAARGEALRAVSSSILADSLDPPEH